MSRNDQYSPELYDALKRLTLRTCDLILLDGARDYDLSEKPERERSATELATFFFRATQALSPDLFVEAGAKDASSSRRARRFLDRARIVAFEANPYTYQAFRKRNACGAQIEYHHLALSDEPGEVTFNVRERPDGTPRPDGHGSIMERPDGYEQNFTQVKVDATTLDLFFSDYEFDSCALWVDVEGATEHVLGGGRELLARASIVIVEVEDVAKWKGAWIRPDVYSFLYDAGLLPVARDFEYTHQYNVVFVREELLDDQRLRLRVAQYMSARSSPTRSSLGTARG